MAKANDKLTQLSRSEIANMTQAPKAKTREEKLTAVQRATSGLRVEVRVTPQLYGRG